jgi:hypothetical protein
MRSREVPVAAMTAEATVLSPILVSTLSKLEESLLEDMKTAGSTAPGSSAMRERKVLMRMSA